MQAKTFVPLFFILLTQSALAVIHQKQKTIQFLQRLDNQILFAQQNESTNSSMQESTQQVDQASTQESQIKSNQDSDVQGEQNSDQNTTQSTNQESQVKNQTNNEQQNTQASQSDIIQSTNQSQQSQPEQNNSSTPQTNSSQSQQNQTVDENQSQSQQNSTVQQNSECQQIPIEKIEKILDKTISQDDLDGLYDRIEGMINQTFEEYDQKYNQTVQKIQKQLEEIQQQTNSDTILILKTLLQDKKLKLEEVNAKLNQWNSQFGIQCLDYTDCTNCIIKNKCVWCQDAGICMDSEKTDLCVVKLKTIEQCPASLTIEVLTEDQLIDVDDNEIFGRNQNQLTLDDNIQKQITGTLEKKKPDFDEDELLREKAELEEYIMVLQEIIDDKESLYKEQTKSD